MMQMRMTEMTLQVPYIGDETIERDAEGLLAELNLKTDPRWRALLGGKSLRT